MHAFEPHIDQHGGPEEVFCPSKPFLMYRKGSHGAGHWALPGGKLDFGESLEACAAREVLEETGVEVPSATMERVWVTSAVFDHDTHFVTVFMQAEIPKVSQTRYISAIFSLSSCEPLQEKGRGTCSRHVSKDTHCLLHHTAAAEQTTLQVSLPCCADGDLHFSYWAHASICKVTQWSWKQGQEAKNMEPDKCAGWHWFSPQNIPHPRFEPLEELISLHSSNGLQQDSLQGLFSSTIQVQTSFRIYTRSKRSYLVS